MPTGHIHILLLWSNLKAVLLAFLIMATHMDAARSEKASPQIQNDDPSSMLRNTGFNGIGLCDWRGNRNTSACYVQHTALVEKAGEVPKIAACACPGRVCVWSTY